MHADGGGGEGIVRWEIQCAPVLPVVIWCVGRAGQDVVPFEDVGFAGVRGDEFGGIAREGGIFTSKAFVSGFCGHFYEVRDGMLADRLIGGGDCWGLTWVVWSERVVGSVRLLETRIRSRIREWSRINSE